MRLGIDLGGTKIEGVALDETGEICCRKRLPTPAGSYEETLEAIVELVCQIERQTGRSGTLGIGTTSVPAGRSLCGSSCWPEAAMASVSTAITVSPAPTTS